MLFRGYNIDTRVQGALLTLGETSAKETGAERDFELFFPFLVPAIGGGLRESWWYTSMLSPLSVELHDNQQNG